MNARLDRVKCCISRRNGTMVCCVCIDANKCLRQRRKMFIKKDLRKIPEILVDKSDLREELLLGRRSLVYMLEV